ncbi:amidohydrolase [Microbacterium sp. JZ101]
MPALSQGDRVDVIADVRIGGEGRELLAHPEYDVDGVYDVWLADGRIADIAPAGAIRRSGAVLDGAGGWLVPGLWDHHVHTLECALAQGTPSVEHAASAEEAARAAAAAPVRADGRRVVARLRDGLWSDAADLGLLDEVTGDIPTYLVSSDLHGVWLNSAAARREGLAADVAGLVREGAAFLVEQRLKQLAPEDEDAALDRMLAAAAARGVVGVQDLEIGWNADRWRRRMARGDERVRVRFDVYPDDLDRAISEGLSTGEALDGSDRVSFGMLKVISDGSLGTRTAATSAPYADGVSRGRLNVEPRALIELVARAASAGIATTIHAIGDVAARHALDAFAAADVPGRIEHVQLVARTDIARFARLGVEASVQPEHALDDRELAAVEWAAQTAVAYPLRELVEAGACLLLGSDAPVSPLDPWVQMAAAVFRTRDASEPWRVDQALDARTALAASTDGGTADPARVLPGEPADLALVGHDPLTSGADALRAMPVHATLVDGRLTHLG